MSGLITADLRAHIGRPLRPRLRGLRAAAPARRCRAPAAGLTRAKGGPKALQRKPIQRLGPNDHPRRPRAQRHSVAAPPPSLPATLRVRAMRYRRPGFRPQRLLTSVLDPVAFPAADVVALYPDRWEIELGFDEMTTHTLEREEALRSKTPARIRQEVCARRYPSSCYWSRYQPAGLRGPVRQSTRSSGELHSPAADTVHAARAIHRTSQRPAPFPQECGGLAGVPGRSTRSRLPCPASRGLRTPRSTGTEASRD